MSEDMADTVMVVDKNDRVIGSADIDDEVLHRTASLLVFDESSDKLLLVKNGSLWNCPTAVPVHGKDEIDTAADNASIPGIRNAVSRSFGVEKATFLTRVSSGNVVTYVLQSTRSEIGVEEAEHSWLTNTECKAMLDSCTPVFRCIYDLLLKDQWSSIETDSSKIHHSALLGDESKKQGAYGKITTHKESKLRQLMHVSEVFAAIRFLYVSPLPSNMDISSPDMLFCKDILVAVSRSFAAVIRQLPPVILTDVAVFYLVLRALDTVEDDMVAFSTHAEKIAHLKKFHINALENAEWCMTGVGFGDERRLLEEFPKVHRVYRSLAPASQKIIADITKRMADGMAEFVEKDLGQGTRDVKEYNRYCHFVAGLVGEGLSRLFAVSSLERSTLANEIHLSDQMGLFLQKTNIIRDFLEDYVDQRAFWPQTVWKKYSASGDLGYFCDQNVTEVRTKSLHCLNELVADALELIPDCLAYMACLQCAEVFKFCAIPQVMAIATLEKLYCNSDVFTGVVKIRKGLSCKLILKAGSLSDLHEIFYDFLCDIVAKTRKQPNDPSYARIMAACQKGMGLTAHSAMTNRRARTLRRAWIALVFAVFVFWNQIDATVIRATLVVAASMLLFNGIGSRTMRSTLTPADLLKGRTVV